MGWGKFSLDGRKCKNKSTSCVGGVGKEARELLSDLMMIYLVNDRVRSTGDQHACFKDDF